MSIGGGLCNVAARLEVKAVVAVAIGVGSLYGGEGSVGGTLAGAPLLAVL